MSAGHISDGAVAGADGNQGIDLVIDFVDYDAAHAGFRWGIAGQVELPQVTCEREKILESGWLTVINYIHALMDLSTNPYAGTMYTKLQLGPLHLGTQATFKNLATTKATAVMNQRSIVGGIAALVFGDTLSISYGVAYDKYRYNDRNRGFNLQRMGRDVSTRTTWSDIDW